MRKLFTLFLGGCLFVILVWLLFFIIDRVVEGTMFLARTYPDIMFWVFVFVAGIPALIVTGWFTQMETLVDEIIRWVEGKFRKKDGTGPSNSGFPHRSSSCGVCNNLDDPRCIPFGASRRDVEILKEVCKQPTPPRRTP
jgi:hypothetical protein